MTHSVWTMKNKVSVWFMSFIKIIHTDFSHMVSAYQHNDQTRIENIRNISEINELFPMDSQYQWQ